MIVHQMRGHRSGIVQRVNSADSVLCQIFSKARSNTDWIFKQRPCAALANLRFSVEELEAIQRRQMAEIQFATSDEEKYGAFMRYQGPTQNIHNKIMHASQILRNAEQRRHVERMQELALSMEVVTATGRFMDSVIAKRQAEDPN